MPFCVSYFLRQPGPRKSTLSSPYIGGHSPRTLGLTTPRRQAARKLCKNASHACWLGEGSGRALILRVRQPTIAAGKPQGRILPLQPAMHPLWDASLLEKLIYERTCLHTCRSPVNQTPQKRQAPQCLIEREGSAQAFTPPKQKPGHAPTPALHLPAVCANVPATAASCVVPQQAHLPSSSQLLAAEFHER